jgi:uncharacterized protein YwgA
MSSVPSPILPKRLEVLGGLLRRLGTFDMSTFKGRLILQKTVYLMQSMGIFLGYRFNWYVYGPYSPELARHGFELAQRFHEVGPYEFHGQAHQKAFDRFVEFLGNNRRNPIWLEAVASIHFQRKLNTAKPKEQILQDIKNKQPYFTLEICRDAWDALERASLLGGGSVN